MDFDEPRADKHIDLSLEGLATAYLSAKRGKPMRKGPPNLASLTAQLIPVQERVSGVGVAQLRARWGEIVGEKIATICQPDIIKGDTLVIKVMAAAAPMLAMRRDEIIGLVRLAGSSKVRKLSFVRAPMSKPTPKDGHIATKPRRLSSMDAAEQRALDIKLQAVASQDLRTALRRLADATSDLD